MGSSIAPLERTLFHEHWTRNHERFLVREQQFLAGPSGGKRGAKPRRSNDRGHDAVDFGQRSHFDESCFPASILQPKPVPARRSCSRGASEASATQA